MPFLLDQPEVEDYLHRLNAQLRRMPPQERAEVHQELRQHLDLLIAAHEELGASSEEAVGLALCSFGNPAKIGRRLFWEWRRSRWHGPSAEMKAVLAMLALYVASTCLLGAVCVSDMMRFSDTAASILGTLFILAGIPLMAGGLLGRLLPRYAVFGALYATLALMFPPLLISLCVLPWDGDVLPRMLLWLSCWLPCACVSAYVSSARRQRQWYRVRPADLKLHLR